MPAIGNEATRLSQLKSWWDATIATINASIATKLDKPSTAATAGQVLSNNGTQNVWIDAPSGDSYVLPPASEESLGGVTLATGKAGHSGVIGNGADELIVQNPVGKTSGVEMTVDDAYPTKPLGLKVYGNTRQNLWVNPSGTSSGVTFTANENGTITVSGTSTGNSSVVSDAVYSLKPGGAYTLSIDEETDFDNYGFYVQSYDGSSYTTLGRVVGAAKSVKITVPSSSVRCRVGVQVTDTTEISGTYRVMLNEGDTAEPWSPPGLTSVNELEYVFEDDGDPPNATTIPIDLQGHTLNALPDGTRDELHIDGGGNVVLEKRCAVASAPTAAKSWSWESVGERATFSLPSAGPTAQPDETSWLLCDKLPVRDGTSVGEKSYTIVGNAIAYAKNPAISSTATAATVVGSATYIYPLAEPQTIDLGTITLPTLPAPNVTAYASANVEAESEMEYAQLLNVVLSKLHGGGTTLYKGTTWGS